MRVLLALGSGIVVGVAETAVYAAYLRKVGEARGKEATRGERKVLVGRQEVWGKGKGEGDGDVKEIEIWGRGVNGGVRRRVRERWDKEKERNRELESEEKME